MATALQQEYIRDLAVKKVKEFKELKELLVSHNIVKASTDTLEAKTIAEITNRLTDKQASDLIDVLIAKEAPYRDTKYADARIKRVIGLVDEIKQTIAGWDFE